MEDEQLWLQLAVERGAASQAAAASLVRRRAAAGADAPPLEDDLAALGLGPAEVAALSTQLQARRRRCARCGRAHLAPAEPGAPAPCPACGPSGPATPTPASARHRAAPETHSSRRVGPGARLSDRWTVVDVLGQGAMGTVMRVRGPEGQLRAAKVLGGDWGLRRARFEEEIRITARLDHPDIVRVHEWGTTSQGQPFYVMDLAEGRDLRSVLDTGGPLEPVRAALLVARLARALHAAHEQGVIHRDLKPDNVIVDVADGSFAPRLLDFGLAKDTADGAGLTQSNVALGTPNYMAPEQAAGRSRDVDARADVYALGAILYELLVGRPPFEAPSLQELARKIVGPAPPRAPRRLRPEVPPAVEAACLRAMSKERADRPPTALALAEELEAAARARPGRAWSGWLLGAAAASALLAATALVAGRRPPPVDAPPAEAPPVDATPVETAASTLTAPPVETPSTPPPPTGAALEPARAALEQAWCAATFAALRDALDQAELALLHEPGGGEVDLLRGVTLRDLGRWGEARERLLAAEAHPQAQARATLARAVMQVRMLGDAVGLDVLAGLGATAPQGDEERAAAAVAAVYGAARALPPALLLRRAEEVHAAIPAPLAPDALAALAWVLRQHTAQVGGPRAALAALLAAEARRPAGALRYDVAADRAMLLAQAGRLDAARRLVPHLRAVSRDQGLAADVVEATVGARLGLEPVVAAALARYQEQLRRRGLSEDAATALRLQLTRELRRLVVSEPSTVTSLGRFEPGWSFDVVIPPEHAGVYVEVAVDDDVAALDASVRGADADLDLVGRFVRRPGATAELELRADGGGFDEDLSITPPAGAATLPRGLYQVLVVRPRPWPEPIAVTLRVRARDVGAPPPPAWRVTRNVTFRLPAEHAPHIAGAHHAIARGDLDAALDGFAAVEGAGDPGLRLVRADLLARAGRHAEARALTRDLTLPLAELVRATCDLGQGAAAAAAARLEPLVAAAPDLVDAAVLRLEALLAAGRPGEAAAGARALLARDPGLGRARVIAALADLPAEAPRLPRAALEGVSPSGVRLAAEELLRRHGYEGALEVLDVARGRWPDGPWVFEALRARALAGLGLRDEAVATAARAAARPLAPATRAALEAGGVLRAGE